MRTVGISGHTFADIAAICEEKKVKLVEAEPTTFTVKQAMEQISDTHLCCQYDAPKKVQFFPKQIVKLPSMSQAKRRKMARRKK